MADKLRFDGRVVLITGAGGGLGREYALAFASKGASVVVNDLGGDMKGSGKSSMAADKVVQEILSCGGKAVADYNSVEDGEKVVQTALEAFGRIDVVINNAGILRDRSFGRTSDTDWDLVHRVHLRGAFQVTRAAWAHMKRQKYGKIIMTSSSAGVLGNFGQANYSAAKLGLVGLSNTLAIEGAKYNIYCNAIVPLAGSRLTQTIMPLELVEALKPAYVAPYVVYLCHESCPETGGVFEIAAGWAAQLRWYETPGLNLRKGVQTVTPELVRDNWAKITDWAGAKERKVRESLSLVMDKLEDAKTSPVTETKEGSTRIKQHSLPATSFAYDAKDVILYALGVGATVQEDMSHLKFLYEGSDDFSALPTFGVIPAQKSMGTLITGQEDMVPGLKINPAKILHGEQYLELYKPIPTSGNFTNKAEVQDVLDKGKGALILIKVTTYDDKGQAVCFNQFSFYLGGAGGFGGKKRSEHAIPLVTMPSRRPDATVHQKTSTSQAALYRLSGDFNPIHIDPNFAKIGGLSRPIIHGLCTFGHAARHVLKQYANNDVTKFKAIKVRFSKPIYPGQTLQTEMWKNGNRISFQCKTVENGDLVLSGAYIDLFDVDEVKGKVFQQDVRTPLSNGTTSGLKSEALFTEISNRISDQPDLVKKVRGIFVWNVTKDGKTAGQWTVDLKNEPGSVNTGMLKKGKPDCTITVSDDDLMAIASGKASPQGLFMKGKLKIKGNVMLTTKLSQLFKEHAKL